MKRLSLFAVLSTIFLFHACVEDSCDAYRTFSVYEPVVLTLEEMRQPPAVEPARELENPGKLYAYQNYLLVNELNEGIHIIDNINPEQPQPVSFIRIKGNVDMAVKNDILYTDQYLDLLAIDISDPADPRLVSREEGVFPYPMMTDDGLIVEFIETQQTEKYPCDEPEFGLPFFWRGDVLFTDVNTTPGAALDLESSSQSSTGIGGSMASFTIVGDYLYTVDESSLHVFDIANPVNVVQANTIHMGWGIETVYPKRGHLFIGHNSGMHIYDINIPAEPQYVSTFSHVTACDPVVVSGDYAFVTLRDGNNCFNEINELDVLDITDLYNPQLVRQYPMHNPHGLTVPGQTLYLCEGEEGLKVFDASDVERIDENQLDHLSGFFAYDVIAFTQNHLLLIGQDGLYQFDTTDPANMREISVISVNR